MEGMESFLEMRTAFNLFDKDGDGIITKSELNQTFLNLGHECTEEDIEEIFKQYNCKEGINFGNFLEIATNKRFSRSKLNEDLKEAFKIFDRDDMNFISREDLSFILKNFCNTLTHEEVDELIREVDENGDGNISFDEFIQMVMMK